MTLHVCAMTSGRNAPASRFRVRQHIQPLRQHGIEVREYVPRVPLAMPMPGALSRVRRRWLGPITAGWFAAHAASRLPAIVGSRAADVVWLERVLAPGFDLLAKVLRRPLVLDIDDAVWLEGLAGRASPSLARMATTVIAGNRFLADWASTHCSSVHVVPTAIDCRRFTPRSGPPPGDRFVMGWTGTSGNFPYLETVAPALKHVLQHVPGAELLVVADRPPVLQALDGLRVRFVRWTPSVEVDALEAMDVGLMPLHDTEWAKGKCSFKMLQYMAAGLPTVVSPFGMNQEVLAHGESGLAASSIDDWVDALRLLADSPERRTNLGMTGRSVALAHYDTPVVAAQIARALRGAAGSHFGRTSL